MINLIYFDIFGGLKDMIREALYNFCRIICQLIYFFEQAFFYLSGAKAVPTTTGTSQIGASSLLTNIITDSKITQIFFGFLILGLFLLVLSFIISYFKNSFSKDVPGGMKKTFGNTAKGIVIMLMIPMFFFTFTLLVGLVFTSLTSFMGQTVSGTSLDNNNASILSSIGQNVITVSFLGGNDAPSNIPFMNIYGIEGEYMTFSYLSRQRYTMNVFSGDFNHLVCIVVGCMVLYNMLVATVQLVERLISIVLLYFCAPAVIAQMPLDDGGRLSLWKDQVIVKFISAIGCVISMYIFILLISIISRTFDPSTVNGAISFIYKIIKVITLIGGSMVCAKAGGLVAGLVSTAAGQSEQANTAATSGMVRGDLGMAKAGILGGGALALGLGTKGSRQANRIGKAMGGSGMGGGAGGSIPGGGIAGGQFKRGKLATMGKALANTGIAKVAKGALVAAATMTGLKALFNRGAFSTKRKMQWNEAKGRAAAEKEQRKAAKLNDKNQNRENVRDTKAIFKTMGNGGGRKFLQNQAKTKRLAELANSKEETK